MPKNKDKNYFLTIIGSVIMLLLTAFAYIICWIVWKLNRFTYLLWIDIFFSIAFLLSIVIFLYFLSLHKTHFDNFQEEKPFVDFSIALRLFTLFVICLTSGVFLSIYKPFYFYIMCE